MNKIKTLVRKEVLDILRDKKTLIIMVAVPILLYPAMIIGMVLLMNMITSSQQETVHTAAYCEEYEEQAAALQEIYEENAEEFDLQLKFLPLREADKEASKDSYDAWISFAEGESGLNITVEYTSTDQDSGYTESILEDVAELYRDALLAEKLAAHGLTEDFLTPVTYEAKDSVSASESAGMNLGGSIGMLLVVTIMLGAFYPAIDATTGEKERGT
ncbi:MAG: ABC transporter permease subunit, partial [Lachnospiraceae bacterium]|nr:ABC transporter permease subunit [Lachnospiraceae bacterium]